MPITLRELAERRGEVAFVYQGQEVHVRYLVESITKEFRAETLRLSREGTRIQRRGEELVTRIRTVTAPDGSVEAIAEDAEAEKAILQLQADDRLLKSQIDSIVAHVVDEWDVLQEDGSMLPLTPEALYPLPPDFERVVLEAIMKATAAGEANGRPSMKPLLSTSKPTEKQGTSRRRQNG